MMRSAHLLLDGEPKIFSDSLALSLSGAETEAALMARIDNLAAPIAAKHGPDRAEAAFQHLRAAVTMRSRYTEDALSQAIRRGIGQYVILGAGLDSFAYRRKDLAGALRVFELDMPVSQQWKRTRLRAMGIAEPDNLTFIPIDLERQSLPDALCAGGYLMAEPSFISWLGMTEYLTAVTVFRTLEEVASLAPGSEIVFQYQLSEHLLDEANRRLLDVLRTGARAYGEPWLSLFDPVDLAERVRKLGFAEVVDFGAEQAQEHYFSGRKDNLPTPYLCHLMRARTGGDR